MSETRRPRTVWFAAVLLLLGMLAAGLLHPAGVLAHAFLERSDPAANAVLAQAPASVRMWFTEPIEADFSKAELYDAGGNLVPTSASQIGDRNELILPLPANLPNGTYTVQWRDVSAADGHPEAGYLPFTIGTQNDVVSPVVPKITDFNAPPGWLSASARWLSLVGVTFAIGALVCWLWALRPAARGLPDEIAERVQERVYRLALVGVAVGAVGDLLALSVQAANAGDGYGPGAMYHVALDTRWGFYWLARIALLSALAVAASSPTLWDDPPARPTTLAALGAAAAALVPFAMVSHAAAQETGEQAAIAADWLHLATSTVWVGGLAALLAGLIYGARAAPGPVRRAAFAGAIERFTTLAVASVVLLALTGFYSAWLQVGNLTALRETNYGHTLIVKLILIAIMLLLGLLNQRWIGPRLRATAGTGRLFGRSVAAEVVLGVGVLFAVGILTSLPPARDSIVASAGATSFHYNQEGLHAALFVSPGAAGFNRYTVDVAPDIGSLPPSAQVLLRVSSLDNTVEGVREITLPKISENRYEASGSELSVVGNWKLELIVRLPDVGDWRVTAQTKIEREPPARRLPGPPPRFEGLNAGIAILFGGLAVVAIVAGLRHSPTRREQLTVAGFGVALLAAGALILGVNLAPSITASASAAGPPIPMSPQSVATGRELFVNECAVCHGESGRGDGPRAPELKVPPADLLNQHVDQHSDADLHWYISKGIGDNMPGFENRLSDADIWNLVNYVRSLRHPLDTSATPTATP